MTPKFSFHSQTLPTPGVSCSRSAESSVLTIDIAVICMKPDHGNRTAHPFRHKPFSELAPSQISNFKSKIPTNQFVPIREIRGPIPFSDQALLSVLAPLPTSLSHF